jgi:phosphatidylinositol kinase/protein kinase (PI-3  family)
LDETAKINASLFALAEHQRHPTEQDSTEQRKSHTQNKLENNKQQRNKTAVIIKRRIKEKLEGRDPDAAVRKSVADQVSHVVSEARAIHNLALMYEGWTSWV